MNRKINNMKKVIVIFLSMLFGLVKAQPTIPIHVINSAGGGGPVGGTGVEVYYNIGETVISTLSCPNNIITQGFLQPDFVGKYGLSITALVNQITCIDQTDGSITIIPTISGLGVAVTPTYQYFWTPASLSLCPTNTCATIDSLAAGSYSVMVIATYGSKIDTAFIDDIQIKTNAAPCQITIFNGVTPNGDGSNDIFYIKNIDLFPNNVVTIYNRWGQRLDEIKSYNNTSNFWDGSNNGPNGLKQPSPSGTYFFIIDLGNGSQPIKGWLELTKH